MEPTPSTDLLVRAAAPAAVTVRSGIPECLHHGVGTAVRSGATGTAAETIACLGDPTAVTLPRSALKLLHAVAFLDHGLDVDDELLAVLCASHSGEPGHLEVVRRLLARAGLSEADLRNTPTLPIDEEAAFRWRSEGGGPSRLRQNCSGNHAGTLATCVAAGWPTEGYTETDHPVQQAIATTVARLAGWVDERVAVDGCGAPAFATTVHGLALAYARLAGASVGTPEARVVAAVTAYPWLVAGTGRRNTQLMRAVPGLVAKDGADGVLAAGFRDDDGAGVGIAVKVLDGAERPRGAVLAEGLRRAGRHVGTDTPGVAEPVLGHGRPVGEVLALPWS